MIKDILPGELGRREPLLALWRPPNSPGKIRRGSSPTSEDVQAFSPLRAGRWLCHHCLGMDAARWEGMQSSLTFPARLQAPSQPHIAPAPHPSSAPGLDKEQTWGCSRTPGPGLGRSRSSW